MGPETGVFTRPGKQTWYYIHRSETNDNKTRIESDFTSISGSSKPRLCLVEDRRQLWSGAFCDRVKTVTTSFRYQSTICSSAETSVFFFANITEDANCNSSLQRRLSFYKSQKGNKFEFSVFNSLTCVLRIQGCEIRSTVECQFLKPPREKDFGWTEEVQMSGVKKQIRENRFWFELPEVLEISTSLIYHHKRSFDILTSNILSAKYRFRIACHNM